MIDIPFRKSSFQFDSCDFCAQRCSCRIIKYNRVNRVNSSAIYFLSKTVEEVLWITVLFVVSTEN